MTTTVAVYVWVSIGTKIPKMNPKWNIGNLHPFQVLEPSAFPTDYGSDSLVLRAKICNLGLLDELDVLGVNFLLPKRLSPKRIFIWVISLWVMQHDGEGQRCHEKVECMA